MLVAKADIEWLSMAEKQLSNRVSAVSNERYLLTTWGTRATCEKRYLSTGVAEPAEVSKWRIQGWARSVRRGKGAVPVLKGVFGADLVGKIKQNHEEKIAVWRFHD